MAALNIQGRTRLGLVRGAADWKLRVRVHTKSGSTNEVDCTPRCEAMDVQLVSVNESLSIEEPATEGKCCRVAREDQAGERK